MVLELLELLERGSRAESVVVFASRAAQRTTSFAELWELSATAASAIQNHSQARIAGMMSSCPEMVAVLVGTLRAGRDFVSLPQPPHGLGAEDLSSHLKRLLRLTGAECIVAEAGLARRIQESNSEVPVYEAENLVAGSKTGLGTRETGSLIQCSSGTTGSPKAVLLSSYAIAASIEATIDVIDLGPGDVSCHWVPLSHDMGLVGGLLTSWAATGRAGAGAPLVYYCATPERFLSRPLSWLEACSSLRGTFTTAPAFAYDFATRLLGRSRQRLQLETLRVCGVGAEPINPDTLRRFADAARPFGFHEEALCPGYGLAEATLVVTLVPPGQRWTSRTISVDGRNSEHVSCGAPIASVELNTADLELGPNTIEVRGPAVGRNLVAPEARNGWHDTRDIGVLLNGELFVTGRVDDFFKIGGGGVHAWEIERVVNACSGIRRGSSIAVSDRKGRYVIFTEPLKTALKTGDLARTLRTELAATFGIGPSAIGFVPRGLTPKTPSGKLRRRVIENDWQGYVSACSVFQEY